MRMNKIFGSFAVLMVCAAIVCAAPQKPKVAVMRSSDGRHNTEFTPALESLGWDVDYCDYNEESLKKFSENLSSYDFIITVPLFNWKDEDNLVPNGEIKERFLKYIKDGGLFIMTDGSYDTTRRWMSALGDNFGGVEFGYCNSSHWSVNGTTHDAHPPHLVRYFPNLITENNSWPHFLHQDVNSKWVPIVYCSQGFPVTFTQGWGDGLVVLTALRQLSRAQMENYFAFSQLRKNMIDVKKFEMSPICVGKGSMLMELAKPVTKKASLTYEVTDATGETDRFNVDLDGTSCKMDFKVAKRGYITVALILNVGDSNITLLSKKEFIPELVSLKPNSYRGILSTKRRVSEVNFYVQVSPMEDDLKNTPLVVSVFDSLNNNVASVTKKLSNEDAKKELVIPVPMSKELPAGEYTVKAELLKAVASYEKPTAEVKITIMDPHPSQAIIDEDNTFLVNGTPFFPLGIYHAPPSVFPRLKEIGLNSTQFWQWFAGKDEYGVYPAVSLAMAHGLKLLVELGEKSEEVIKDNCENMAKYPAVLMWYLIDEPPESSYGLATKISDTYHKYDTQHPTFSLSCRPDLFREQALLGDVFSCDPYGAPPLVADWTQGAVRAVDNRKATILVLSSFDESMEGLHQPPDRFRANAYAAIVHDARGIFWYPWTQMGGGPIGVGLNKSEVLQKEMTRVCSEIKTIMPGITSTARRSFKVNESVHAMVCGDQDDKKFLIMVNITDNSVDVEYKVDELVKIGSVKELFGTVEVSDVKIKDGIISQTFGPYEVCVYNW